MDYKGIAIGDNVKMYKKDGTFNKAFVNSVEELLRVVNEKNYRIVGAYLGNFKKMKMVCNNNHSFSIRPANLKNGQGCSICSGKSSKEAEKELKIMIEKNNHNLLSDYLGNKTKVLIDFQCGHEPHLITPLNYKHGHGCPECANLSSEKAKEEINALVIKNNHTLLNEYKNAYTKILIDFNCGHEAHSLLPSDYKRNIGCPKCKNLCSFESKKEFEKLVEKNGHILKSEYKNNRTKVMIDFNCGHEVHKITPNAYKSGDRCPLCNHSKGEKIIEWWLKKKQIQYQSQYSFPTLKNKKYDIILPFENLIIEIHGRQHYQYERHFHRTKEGYKKYIDNDKFKESFARSLGYEYMIIDYREHNPQLALERFISQYEEFKKRKAG